MAAVVLPALAACQPVSAATPDASAAPVLQQEAVRLDAARSHVSRPDVSRSRGSRSAAAPAEVPPAPATSSPPEVAPAAPVEAGEQTGAATGQGDPAPGGAPAPAGPDGSTAAGQGAAGATPSAGGPLAGDTLYGPNAGAAEAAARLQATSPAEAALLAEMAEVPTAMWLGAWLPDVTATVRQRVAEAQAAGAVPVFVAYNVPGLDCGGQSASGGAGSEAGYDSWIRAVAAGIGTAEAVVVVEPDTLALLCGDPDQRIRLVRAAVAALEANPGTHTYLDAGHSGWVDVPTMVQRLRAAGVAEADGFALNVSNFEPTDANVAYGSALSAELSGAHFVVDTSRNGNGPGDDWCNPSGRALGQETTTQTGNPLADAFIWIKRPGESDGACNGGPAAGQFWLDYALGLARN